MIKLLSVTLVLLSLSPLSAAAGPPPGSVALEALLDKGLDELVTLEISLATGTPKPLERAPSVATVITAAEIEAMGATTLDEVLATVPGLHVQHSETNLFTSSWFIRGVATQLNPQVLFLIDGQPVRQNANGNKPHTFRMPVAMIARIEIIRGPGSALLGADAFAGAINVVTKEARDIGGTAAGVRGGSFGAYELWAQHGGTHAGWDVALGLEYAKGDGDPGRILVRDALGSAPPSLAPGPLDTHYETLTSSLSAGRDRLELKLNGFWMMDNGHGPGVLQALSEGSVSRGYSLLGSLAWRERELLPDFDLAATLSGSYLWLENTLDFYPDAYRNQIGKPGCRDLNGGIDLTGEYRGIGGHRLRLSAGLNRFTTDTFQQKNYGPGVPVQYGPLVDISDTPHVYMEDQRRSLGYAGIQDEWAFARDWELTAGLRRDDYSDFGGATSPRVALVWNATRALAAKLLYGRAFRAPTFGEQHLQNNPATLGNPDLDAETIDTYELAFDYRPTGALRLALNLFEYRIEGLIDYVRDPAPATSLTAQNARDQRGRGLEAEAEWLATDALRLRANLSYQRSTDEDTGDVVADIPAVKAYLNAHWSFRPGWSLDGQWFWIGGRPRAESDERPDLGAYDLVNLTLRRKKVLGRWDLALAVRNLFDEEGREPAPPTVPDDYPLESRSVWAELRHAF